jgi:magnesium-transporting ATPase (P-type)
MADIEAKGAEAVEEVVSWHALTTEEVITTLQCNANLTEVGLTSKEATERLEKYGPNKLTEKEKKTIWRRIWDQVANVLVGILVTVAAVSFARAVQEMASADGKSEDIISNWIQVALITTVITVNTWIGIVQEGSAEEAAEALKSMLSSDARVIRDGSEMMVDGTAVVPGDVVILDLGDRIPADLRMVQVRNMACEEAALTGESVPIDKSIDAIKVEGNPEQTPLGDRHNMAFSATLVAQGSGIGVCVTTGDYTQIGTINKLVSQVEEKKTAVLEQIDQVSKWLAFFICIAAIITFFIARFRTKMGWLDCVTTALVCAVAMIPEGLEAIVTLTYAWAVSNMAKNNAIIRALPAVETLGSVTVICSDKTGTLTQNIMSLTTFVTSNSRFRVDVNASDRNPTSFVRDDSYMAKRATHQLKRSVSAVIKDGANTNEPRKGRLAASNHFAVTDLHSEHKNDDDEPQAPAELDTSAPFAPGESPTLEFVESTLAGGVLCSKCVLGKNGTREGAIGNPTELSIIRAAYFGGVDTDAMKKNAPLVNEVPFSSEYKFMATVHNPVTGIDGPDIPSDHYVVHVKGAPDRMLNFCKDQAKSGLVGEANKEPLNRSFWTEQIAILSSHGLRVLGLCRASVPKEEIGESEDLGPEFINGKDPWLTFVGLCAIMDPPRPECVQAIQEAHGAGVRVCMITGDHKDTATAIGHMLGIVDEKFSEALTGPELDEMSDDQLRKAVLTHNVFARSSPQNKIRIVNALQAEGEIAGMTGDGVNDAPALKAANMGVAMGKEGTDVAREAAEMILADDNFATIVTAVREGRVVWDNLRKVLLVNTPINNAQGLTVLLGLAFGLEKTPLTAIQILYSNLICAVTLGMVTAVEPAEDGIMSMPPRRVGKRLIGRFLFLRIMIGTITLSSCVIGSVYILKHINYLNGAYGTPGFGSYGYYNLEQQRAMAFNALDFGAISVCLSARFSYLSAFHPRILSGNAACWYSVAIVTVLQLFTTYVPGINYYIFSQEGLDGVQWALVGCVMVIVFFVMEMEKAIRRMLKNANYDTDDLGLDEPIETAPQGESLTPAGAEKLNLAESTK